MPPTPSRPSSGPFTPQRPQAAAPSTFGLQFMDEFDVHLPMDEAEAQKLAGGKFDHTDQKYIKSNKPVLASTFKNDVIEIIERHRAARQRVAPRVHANRQPWQSGHLPQHAQNAHQHLRAEIGEMNGMLSGPVRFSPGVLRTKVKESDGIKTISAYTFRGDRREVIDIKRANGFAPPSERTDTHFMNLIASRFIKYMETHHHEQYSDAIKEKIKEHIIQNDRMPDRATLVRSAGFVPALRRAYTEYEGWRDVLKDSRLNIKNMVCDEFLRGFVSTSRSVHVAQSFGNRTSAEGAEKTGGVRDYTIYALHTPNGLLLPPRDAHERRSDKHNKQLHEHGYKKEEAEVPHPGFLPWKNVMMFRSHAFTKNDLTRGEKIYVRKGFAQDDPEGFRMVLAAMSLVC